MHVVAENNKLNELNKLNEHHILRKRNKKIKTHVSRCLPSHDVIDVYEAFGVQSIVSLSQYE